MTVRVILVSAAESEASLLHAFENGEPLTPRGRAAAEAVREGGSLSGPGRALLSPTARCRETAEALGMTGSQDPLLAGQSMGDWRGRSLDDLMSTGPAEVAGWLGDPEYAPPGGESLLALIRRVGARVDALAARGGPGEDPGRRLVVVAEPDTVRAAVVHALGLPAQAFWRLDVRPLSATRLSGRAGRWNLLLGETPSH